MLADPGTAPAPATPARPRRSTTKAAVSRETSAELREELVATIPEAGADTPLAQTLAQDARRRIALTGRRLPSPPSTRVLTVANQKGGVGKTTTTVNVAAALAQSGLKVLVIDLDPQGNASTALGVDHHAEVPSVYDVLVDGKAFAEVIVPCPTVEGLFCAPATIDLAGAEIELVSMVAREMRLSRALNDHLATTDLDYVLIDCPPSLGLLTINAFVAAAEVFIPIQCEYYALEGLSQLLKNIELIRGHLNPGLHVSTILLTMYDGRTRLSSQVADEVRSHFPDQVLRTSVPRSVRVSEAPSFGETVMTYDPTSSGALSYLEAAGELAVRGADDISGDRGSAMSEKRRALGRGLGALIPTSPGTARPVDVLPGEHADDHARARPRQQRPTVQSTTSSTTSSDRTTTRRGPRRSLRPRRPARRAAHRAGSHER